MPGWDLKTFLIWLKMSLFILISGLMVVGMKTFAGAGAFVKDFPWVFDGRAWDMLKTWILVMMLLDFFYGPWRGLFLLYRTLCRSILGLTIKMSATTLVEFLMAGMVPL